VRRKGSAENASQLFCIDPFEAVCVSNNIINNSKNICVDLPSVIDDEIFKDIFEKWIIAVACEAKIFNGKSVITILYVARFDTATTTRTQTNV
jgi:hypothetical protein